MRVGSLRVQICTFSAVMFLKSLVFERGAPDFFLH